MRTRKKIDWEKIGIEVLLSVIGALGILAFVAFFTGVHITDWNGGTTGLIFIILTLGIWRIFTILPLTSLD